MENYLWKCAKCDNKWLVQGGRDKPRQCPGCRQHLPPNDFYYCVLSDYDAKQYMSYGRLPHNVQWSN